MSDRAIRLLNSLKSLARGPDWWVSDRVSYPGDRTTDPKIPFADRAHDLRRAFPLADAVSLDALAEICSIVSVPGGTPLVLEGEKPDAVYVVITGRFGTFRLASNLPASNGPASNDEDVSVERIGAGDVIGDVGFITGEAWTVTVKALRNSELLRISKQDLLKVAARCPDVWPAISSSAVQRLQRAQSTTPPRCRTFCFVPADSTVDVRSVTNNVAHSLEAFGTVTIVSAEQAPERNAAWYATIERNSDFVMFQADRSPTAWTGFCLRQCDRIVIVARGDNEPADCQALGTDGINIPHDAKLSLMLLWDDAIAPARTTAWLQSLKPGEHYHVRSSRDIERASRLMVGRGLGLVLSGGGAKALAHVGVINALRENNIQIDAVGGTSIGGIVAAVFALEWDLAATVRSLAVAFSRRRFSDFAVPRTALYSERAFARTLGHCFGDVAIEDSPMPLFCVSTNLTEGTSTVHRTGRLVTWLRATSAVPGMCPPIIEQNAVYVDGGVLNNMPTDAVRDFGVASVIAVDVGSSLEGQGRADGELALPSMLDLLWRVGTIGSDMAMNRMRREGDVLLKPSVGNMGLFDWNAHEKAIAAGHKVALEHLDEIKAALVRQC
jgi:NTE family protein